MWRAMLIGRGFIMSLAIRAIRCGGSEEFGSRPVSTPLDDSGTLPGSSGRCRATHRRSITEENVAVTCGADARRWRGLRHMLDTAGS